jgi:hypothetical protein
VTIALATSQTSTRLLGAFKRYHGRKPHSLLTAQAGKSPKLPPRHGSSRLRYVEAAVTTAGAAHTLQVLPPWVRRNAEKYRFITSSGIMVSINPEQSKGKAVQQQ